METSVESMQAMTIYMLLQAQDTDTIVKNDVKFLLTALAVGTYFHRPSLKPLDSHTAQHTCQKVHETLEYNTFVDTLDNPLDRKTWALYEATRR